MSQKNSGGNCILRDHKIASKQKYLIVTCLQSDIPLGHEFVAYVVLCSSIQFHVAIGFASKSFQISYLLFTHSSCGKIVFRALNTWKNFAPYIFTRNNLFLKKWKDLLNNLSYGVYNTYSAELLLNNLSYGFYNAYSAELSIVFKLK